MRNRAASISGVTCASSDRPAMDVSDQTCCCTIERRKDVPDAVETLRISENGARCQSRKRRGREEKELMSVSVYQYPLAVHLFRV
jgi:hypothetical protein